VFFFGGELVKEKKKRNERMIISLQTTDILKAMISGKT
jgi:hypothetical protein